MIYITGDTHGEKERFTTEYIPFEKELTSEDVLIVCGDFGFIFTCDKEEEKVLHELSKKPYTICFVDGNHENFHAIFDYPEEHWCGGRIHRIRKNIIHLMRGQVFEIQGKKIFTFGGAYSLDRCLRTLNETYWLEELPDNYQFKEATDSLRKHNNKVDIILTHTAPVIMIHSMKAYPDAHDLELTGFLDWIYHEVEFSNWYFGHWHQDLQFDEKIRALYYNIVKVE